MISIPRVVLFLLGAVLLLANTSVAQNTTAAAGKTTLPKWWKQYKMTLGTYQPRIYASFAAFEFASLSSFSFSYSLCIQELVSRNVTSWQGDREYPRPVTNAL
jgi:hypothetical protein